jgi:hypothetical protein
MSDEFESESLADAIVYFGHEAAVFTLDVVRFEFDASGMKAYYRAVLARADSHSSFRMPTLAISMRSSISVFAHQEPRVCRDYPSLRAALAAFGEAVVKPSFGYGGASVEKAIFG